MSELKAYQVDGFLKKRPVKHGIYLIYGSDTGLIHERAIALCNAHFEGSEPKQKLHADVVVLEMDELVTNPSRLAV
ncbi:MAG: hypothetical protein L3J13_09380 [Devosiaceae bacterium]|nr:hypothetical protein [Devosiaceae bacterium]